MAQLPNSPDPLRLARHDPQELLDRFEQAWQSGQTPQLEDYLPDRPLSGPGVGDAERWKLLKELIRIDLENRWRHGFANFRRLCRQFEPHRALQGRHAVWRWRFWLCAARAPVGSDQPG